MEPVMTRFRAMDTLFADFLYFASSVLARQVDKLEKKELVYRYTEKH
jgi:DNA-binding MarR family transcriptional regulator